MKRLLVLSSLLFVVTAHAAKPAASAVGWPEPSTFMGLNLGAPVAAQSVLIACPKKPLYSGTTEMTRDYSDKRFCYEPPRYEDSSFGTHGMVRT
jgi:hypothetical protein